MTLNLELTPEIEQSLSETAQQQGLSVPEYALQLLTQAVVEQHRLRQQRSFAQAMREAAHDSLFMEDIATVTRDFAAADAEAMWLEQAEAGAES